MGLGINVQGVIIPVAVVILAERPLALWVDDRLTGLDGWRGSGVCRIPAQKPLDRLAKVEGAVIQKLRHV
jgi:hypothetical protein